jgi:hypothetical protein
MKMCDTIRNPPQEDRSSLQDEFPLGDSSTVTSTECIDLGKPPNCVKKISPVLDSHLKELLLI